jgi:acyl-homoserine-lactone acylase
MKRFLFFFLLPLFAQTQFLSPEELDSCKAEAQRVSIIRDTWGIPHIYGKTDADVVFGLMYAQCEEDFERVERNYLEVFGRLAEIDGKTRIFDDLQMRMIYDSSAAKQDFENSPPWLKKLLHAFADGINYFLYNHPDLKHHLLNRFQPWFPLMFTDGSISATQMGGLTIKDTKELYAPVQFLTENREKEQEADPVGLGGSNGFALAPSRTESGNAILYINPHVTFYFRTEVQLVSEEGLDAYGAVTWGQFFVYQGFNAHCGWMHTSSYADVADLYMEKTETKKDSVFYEYESQQYPVKSRNLLLKYRSDDGIGSWPVKVYFTRHGPVMGSRSGIWLSLKEHNRSLTALEQSWLRTKAKDFGEFKQIMDLRSNNSNNTVYADDKGNIAYWHGNFMPVRDTAYDWSLPVDGTLAATEWKGLHTVDQTIHIYNPASGWIQNCNSTPFSASGESSPLKKDYPPYMAPDSQNPRALNAMRLFGGKNKFTLDKMIAAGFDHYLSAFAILLPPLLDAYAKLDEHDSLKKQLAGPISVLKAWDKYGSEQSIATTLAIFWGNEMLLKLPVIRNSTKEKDQVVLLHILAEKTPGSEQLGLLSAVLAKLQKMSGTWKTPWGDLNRYQRNNGYILAGFSDDKPSLPVGMASSRWGSIPAFESRTYDKTLKLYGYGGNSFVAAVEFGKKLTAKTVVTGGQSADPSSKHFDDQSSLYINGKLKDIFFYKEDLLQHLERQYHPGE